MRGTKNWILTFSLSEKIPYYILKGDCDITFITEGHYMTGFKVTVQGLDQAEAKENIDQKANVVQRLIIIGSGMDIQFHQTTCEQTGNQYPRTIQSSIIMPYRIKGKIDKLDLNDKVFQNLLASSPNKNLKFLSDAIVLKYYGFNEYSIRESYKILEDKGTRDPKFTVLRHAFSHQKLDKRGKFDWFDKFNNVYGPNYFDYEFYDVNNEDFLINFGSNRTQLELGKLAKELIDKCKALFGL